MIWRSGFPKCAPSPDVRAATIEECAKHFEQRRFGTDRYLFPDEIAAELRALLVSRPECK